MSKHDKYNTSRVNVLPRLDTFSIKYMCLLYDLYGHTFKEISVTRMLAAECIDYLVTISSSLSFPEIYHVFPHFEKNYFEVLIRVFLKLHTGSWKCALCELYACTFYNHVCSTNLRSLKKQIQPYQMLKISAKRLTAF